MGRAASASGYSLLTNPDVVADHLRRWHGILQAGANSLGQNRWWLPEEDVGFRLLGGDRQRHGVPGADFATTPACHPSTVEFNMPLHPGTVDGSVQIGLGPDAKLWLLRQGRLNGGGDAQRVDEARFEALTGLPCAFTTPAHGRNPERRWFKVCQIDASSDTHIRAQTTAFIRRCQDARDAATADVPPAHAGTLARARGLVGALEPTGPFVIPPQDARVARRLHGVVVNTLRDRLGDIGIIAEKVWHIDGYEIDLAIPCPPAPLLVEVKTGALAADIHTGVGQLALYPELMPELKQHRRVLLLPGAPPPALAQPIATQGVLCHWYGWAGAAAGEGAVVFSPEFEALCGLA